MQRWQDITPFSDSNHIMSDLTCGEINGIVVPCIMSGLSNKGTVLAVAVGDVVPQLTVIVSVVELLRAVTLGNGGWRI